MYHGVLEKDGCFDGVYYYEKNNPEKDTRIDYLDLWKGFQVFSKQREEEEEEEGIAP